MAGEPKIEFIIPSVITLAGSTINVQFNPELAELGLYYSNRNLIELSPNATPAIQFETFIHELSEAIQDKLINKKEGDVTIDHTIVDGYGRGIYNFLVENVGRITKHAAQAKPQKRNSKGTD